MSDLNNFMMIEDLKINEQEEKFIEQSKQNINKKREEEKEEEEKLAQAQNIGSFEESAQELDDEQQDLAKDLGVKFHEELAPTVPQDSFIAGIQDEFNNPDPIEEQNQNFNLNLQNQIKNIDSIFEPEPEVMAVPDQSEQ